MPTTCPSCGAALQGDRTCQTVFDEFLALEFTDAGYGAVHFLTVACYMVQHGQYSDEGLAWIEQQLRDHLEGGVPVERIRRQAAREVGQDQRGWKITRRPGDPPQEKAAWSMTIMTIAAAAHDAASYRALVTEWARVTLREMQSILRK